MRGMQLCRGADQTGNFAGFQPVSMCSVRVRKARYFNMSLLFNEPYRKLRPETSRPR
jgi:hypothetical protein